MKHLKSKLTFLILLLISTQLFAVDPKEMLSDSKLEARARAISENLRCLVCQNQSIDDSDADLARDLRTLVRQRLQVGDSDAQVKRYVVERYGDYVLLNPPFKFSTIILWTSPFVMLLFGVLLAVVFFRNSKQSKSDSVVPLSEEEKKRLVTFKKIGDK